MKKRPFCAIPIMLFMICACLEITPAYSQTSFTVGGKVTDGMNSAPLPGVSIVVKDTDRGVITDSDGRFSITASSSETLVFSFIGYISREIVVGSQTKFEIVLTQDNTVLQEAVVIGYGSQRKSDLTGSISSVKGKDISRISVPRIDQAIQGQVAGVQVTNNSAHPGGTVSMRIRGNNSINGNNEPLIVIDGILGGNLSQINPNDIESVEILKDASAAAIYGSRGANGVVIVSTRRGKTGATQFGVSTYQGIQKVTNRLDLLNAKEQLGILNALPDAQKVNLIPILNNVDQSVDTDWQKEVLQTAPISSYQLNVSGGGEKTRFALSGNYFGQKGIVKRSDFKRAGLRLNLDHDISRKIKVGLNLNYSRSMSNFSKINSPGGSEGGSVTQAASRMSPMVPVYDLTGAYSGPLVPGALLNNPVALVNERIDRYGVNFVQGALFGIYEFVKGLEFKTNLAYTSTTGQNQNYATKRLLESAGQGVAGIANENMQDWLFENTLTYHKVFAQKHSLSLLGGFTAQGTSIFSSTISGRGFSTEVNNYNAIQQATTITAGSANSKSNIASFLGRMNYSLREKYLLTVNFRADGASKFAMNNKWAMFPSAALGWRVSEEAFLKSVKTVSNLKLRASWGKTGSQAIAPYQSFASLATNINAYAWGTVEAIGVRADRVPNPDLKWETTAQTNLGIDLGVLDDRIELIADYYVKKTSDLLYAKNLLWYTGYATQTANIGSMRNKGLELTLNTRNLIHDFQWSTGFNISFNRNKILSLGGDQFTFLNGSGGSLGSEFNTTSIAQVGVPIGLFYGYVFDGIYQNEQEYAQISHPGARPGTVKLRDVNGDKVINSLDRTIIGDPNPDYIFGMTNNFSYKGFDLSILIQASQGNDVINLNRVMLEYAGSTENALRSVLGYWKGEGSTNTMQGLGESVGPMSSRFIEDGSYVRVKNISLGYNFPANVTRALGLSMLRVYVNAVNPLTFTKYSGYDPEINSREGNLLIGYDYGGYPMTKIFTAGLNINF